MRRTACLFMLLAFLCCPVLQADILKIILEGPIDPVTADFVADAVEKAREQKSDFLLVALSTPGGLSTSMQQIIQVFLNSQVPIVCYVTPKGTHAASAGFFILLSADVAAMSPGTNTGAAHPVFPFGMENKVMLEKVRNDALANLRSIVKERKRNYEMAEKAVLESKSFTAQEALDGGLIDLIAQDEKDLLQLLHGREVARFDGKKQKLETTGKSVDLMEPTLRQRILGTVANPDMALILGLIGLLGLYIEFTHPGLIVPGVVGAVCLILSLLGFSLLPISAVGVILILLSFGLFVAEVKVQGFGILGIGGAVSMLLGIMLLIDSPDPGIRIGFRLALAVAAGFSLIFILLFRLAITALRHRVTTGKAGMIGMVGEAHGSVGPDGGKVFINGEWWRAVSSASIPDKSKIRVLATRDLTLIVEPLSGSEFDLGSMENRDKN